MKERLTRFGVLGLALLVVMAVAAAPATAKKKKPKKRTVEVTKTATVNQCVNTSVPILDGGTPGNGPAIASIPVSIPLLRGAPQTGAVTAFTSVDVRLTHPFDGDLSIFLISPAGGFIPLALNRGGTGDDYGTGATNCAGTRTFFTDTAPTSISTGTAPFAGSFKPEAPLSGLVGGPAGGIWRLLVIDTNSGDIGTLHAFSLNFTYSYKELVTIKPKKKKKKK